MKFEPIDFNTWPRRETFYYFSQMAPTSYSLTVEIDVTELVCTLKKCGKKFFPTYLWLVTKCLNQQQEFKIAVKEGQLGCYNKLTPLYASFHDDDKTFSLMWTEYDDDYDTFYRNYCRNQQECSGQHGILCQPQTPPPENAYTVSCIPWVSFKHFAVHTHDNKDYFFPSVEAGKYCKNADGRLMMPLSLTCHHATTDGYHVDRFLKSLDAEINALCLSMRQ